MEIGEKEYLPKASKQYTITVPTTGYTTEGGNTFIDINTKGVKPTDMVQFFLSASNPSEELIDDYSEIKDITPMVNAIRIFVENIPSSTFEIILFVPDVVKVTE